MTLQSDIDARTGLEVLDRVECLHRLGTGHFGRLGVCVDGQPIVLPVNYALDGDDIVFRSAPGTKVTASIGRPVAFEIDGHEAFSHAGWSVLVVGTGGEIDRSELYGRRGESLHPAAPGEREHIIRIRTDMVTGRRFGPARL